jgi:hypothetical protein
MFAQVVADTFNIPNYPIPDLYFTDSAPGLPDNVWNHKLKYFPDSLIVQIGSTCGQTSGIFNCLTYMFNRAYDREADSSNIFPPNYTYNQLSRYYGVSAFDSWNIVKSQGHPSQLEYETINFNASQSNPDFNNTHFKQYWMQGYENYYKSFFNRISEYYSLDLHSDEDLLLLKHFLHNIFDSGNNGGIAMFCTQPLTETHVYTTLYLPETAIDQNYTSAFRVLDTIEHHENPTHQMTLVGYYKNDIVDFNGDGIISDTIDINHDGEINMHDNESTLWIVLNSWRDYYPYYLLKYDAVQLFWNQQVFFPIPDTAYYPELTFKLQLKHAERGDLKISAGISSDVKSEIPEIEINFPVFNYQGTDICMSGIDSLPEPNILEFGIDITDIKNYISESGNYKIFLRIENTGFTEGELQFFSIIDYSDPNPIEYVIENTPSSIQPASDKYYTKEIFIDNNSFNNHLQVNDLNEITNSINTLKYLEIVPSFGQEPYEFFIVNKNEYRADLSYNAYPSDSAFTYETINLKTINPEWNIEFANRIWDSISMLSSGKILFRHVPFLTTELYPYQYTTAQEEKVIEFSPFENDKLRGNPKPIASIINDTYIEVFIKRDYYVNSNRIYKNDQYLKLSNNGKIEIIYGDTIPQYSIFANISTNTNKYYIPYEETLLDSFNTVTFTPNPIDSLFTIDENGVLTMQPVSLAGVYETYVLVRDANGQEFTKRIEVNVINENIIGNLYPNPANDIIYCDIYNPIEQNARIEIYSITGQLVYKYVTSQIVGITNYSFSTKQFGQGVYLLKVSIGDKSQTQRFVVTK